VLASLEDWSTPKVADAHASARVLVVAAGLPKQQKKVTTRGAILSVMPVGVEMAKQAILDALKLVANLNENTVGVELSRMVSADLLDSNKRGVYTRKDKGPAV
jgi:hypothetical protein